MSLSELLPIKDVELNGLIDQLDQESQAILKKIKLGFDFKKRKEIITQIRSCFSIIRIINSRVQNVVSRLRADLADHLEKEAEDWKRQSWHGASPEEMEVSRELNTLINIQSELIDIRESINDSLGKLGIEIL